MAVLARCWRLISSWSPKMILRQRWVVNQRGQLANSANLPVRSRPSEASGDRKHPKADAMAVIFDIMSIIILNSAGDTGWADLERDMVALDGQQTWDFLLSANSKFSFGFFRLCMPFLFMWLFAILMNGWFGKESSQMPWEYGGNTDFMTGEYLMVPSMVLMLALAYNKEFCVTSLAWFSEKAAEELTGETGWTAKSTNCGHYVNAEKNVDVRAPVGFFPAQPCAAYTWGSCLYETITLIVYHIFTVGCLLLVTFTLPSRDYKVSKRTIRSFLWSQIFSLVCHCLGLVQAVHAYRQKQAPSAENVHNDPLVWFAFYVKTFAEVSNFAPFVWMLALGFARKKHAALPFDAEYLADRAKQIIKIAFTNVLVVGFKSKFHNGLFVDKTLKYAPEMKRNVLPLLIPLWVFGAKMLYFDTMAFATFGVNTHPVDRGPTRAILWLFLQVMLVCNSSLMAQCLSNIVSNGRWARSIEKKLVAFTTAIFLLNMAGLQAVRFHFKKQSGDVHFRRCRKVILRVVFAIIFVVMALALPPVLSWEGPGELSPHTWISLLGLAVIGLLERFLDAQFPASCLKRRGGDAPQRRYSERREYDPSEDFWTVACTDVEDSVRPSEDVLMVSFQA